MTEGTEGIIQSPEHVGDPETEAQRQERERREAEEAAQERARREAEAAQAEPAPEAEEGQP